VSVKSERYLVFALDLKEMERNISAIRKELAHSKVEDLCEEQRTKRLNTLKQLDALEASIPILARLVGVGKIKEARALANHILESTGELMCSSEGR